MMQKNNELMNNEELIVSNMFDIYRYDNKSIKDIILLNFILIRSQIK